MTSKVLKVLNFSGAGEGNTFTCTFTGAAVNPHPDPERPSPRRHPEGTRPYAQGEGDLRSGAAISRTYKSKFV
jgi:hypothetical protein